jgi:fatty acid desaturase
MVDKSAFAGPSVTYIARRAMPALARYRGPCHSRSIAEIAVTLVPFVALWTAAWVAVHLGRWELSLLLGIPAAGLLVRLFMIQHDCGHGSFFRHRSANDWVGRFLGILTLTPYDDWRRAHAIHHAASGHLDQRGVGDISTLTVREFQALATWGRLRYRLYRHPFVMFGLGAAYQFLLRHRLPTGPIRGGWQAWISVMATNLAIAATAVALIWLIGIGPFLLVHLPIAILAGSAGSGYFTYSISSKGHSGRMAENGVFMRQRFVEALTMTCREFCAGSRRTSACTTSTICAAASPFTGCQKPFGTIPICVASVGSRCFKVFAALGSCCGMRAASG